MERQSIRCAGYAASITLEFLADGKLLFNMDGSILPSAAGVEMPQIAGEWSLAAGQLTLDLPGQTLTGMLDGDRIVIKEDNVLLRRVAQ